MITEALYFTNIVLESKLDFSLVIPGETDYTLAPSLMSYKEKR